VRRRLALAALAAAAAAALTLSACGGQGNDDGAAAPDASPDASPDVSADGPTEGGRVPVEPPDCLPDGARAHRAGPESTPTLVAVVGEGETGVVLAPQNGGDWCQWAGEVARLVAAGHTVVTFTWSADSAASLELAVDAVRDAGVRAFALVGASKGGTYSAALADELEPAAVVALSPPTEFEGVDARAAVSGYTGPLLVVASADDRDTPAASSREVARDDATYLEVPGGAHGVRILEGESADEVRAAMDATLAEGLGG